MRCFGVTFDANPVTTSYEITLDTYLGEVGFDHYFGYAAWTDELVTNRLLTNGQRHDGWVLTHSAMAVNAANAVDTHLRPCLRNEPPGALR